MIEMWGRNRSTKELVGVVVLAVTLNLFSVFLYLGLKLSGNWESDEK